MEFIMQESLETLLVTNENPLKEKQNDVAGKSKAVNAYHHLYKQ
jgi:hypothetical protein